ncbi:MAG: phage tail protein [Pseudomonadota bacterium]
MGGSSRSQTIGYKYFLGMHVGLAHGPLDAVVEFQFDERVAWQGNATGGTITINAPLLYGGDRREGGVSGSIDVEMGTPAQVQNTYLQGQLGTDISAYRGVACLVFNQFYFGNNPYLKPFKVLANRTDVSARGEVQWNVEDAKIGRPSVAGLEPDECDYANFTRTTEPDFATYFPLSAGLATIDVAGSTGWGNEGLSWTNVSDAPLTIPCGNSNSLILSQSLASGARLTSPDLVNAQRIDAFIIARSTEVGSLFIDVQLLEQVAGFLFDSGPNTDVSVSPRVGVGLDYDSGGDRARFFALLNDTDIGGFNSVFGDYFDVDPSQRDWTIITYSCSFLNLRSEEFQVNPITTRYRLIVDYTVNACVKHVLNGVERTDTFSDVRTAILSPSWVNPITNIRPDLSYTTPPDLMQSGRWQLASYYFLNAGEGATCPTFSLFSPPIGDCSDMNPAHIVRECLTDTLWGMGYASGDIDDTSFQSAADTLLSEGMGMSILWDREIPLEDFIGEILRHIDATLYVSRTTGQFVLKLIREETPTITLDESNVREVNNAKRQTISELTNQINVIFWDCKTDKDGSVSIHNEALRQIQGANNAATIRYPGFSNEAIAQTVATRDLRGLSSPLLSCEVVASRANASLNPGDPFTLNWPDLGINNVVMRADEIDYGDGIDNSIKITCVQDVFSTPSVTSLGTQTEVWIDPDTIAPVAAVARIATETPYYPLVLEIGQSQADDTLEDDPGAGYLLVSAGRAGQEINADVQVDSGGGFESSATLDFHGYATLDADVSQTDTTISFTTPVDLDLVETGTIAQIGDELVRVDSLNESSPTTGEFTSVTVGRGILDTTPRNHLTGAVIAFWGDFAVSDDEQYANAESINVKLLTESGTAQLAEAPTDNVAFNSRAIRPYPPGNLLVDSVSYPSPNTWGGDHTFDWSHRDRIQQTSGDLFDHTTGDIGPEVGVTYRVEGYAYEGSPEVETQFIDVTLSGSPTPKTFTFDAAEVLSNPNVSDPPVGTERIVIRVYSVRGGYDSWQPVEVEFTV